MSLPELHEALAELITAFESEPMAGGPSVVDATLTLPMELRLENHQGKLRALASPPTSRWQTGFVTPIHRIQFTAIRKAFFE